MKNINIKTRILIFVVLFELVAYSSIQLFNNYIYKQEMVQLKHQEILKTFTASTEKIYTLSLLMERNVTDLTIAGEMLYRSKKNDVLTQPQVKKAVTKVLIDNFSRFPEAIGGGIWFEPYALDSELKYFGPYVYQSGNYVNLTWDLNTPEYDYHNQDWYTIASENNWGREQLRARPIVWTAPYLDDAGTFSLMMTVDGIMMDEQRSNVIGMATVDWSLASLTSFLDKVKITKNSFPFLIHKASGKFLSFPKDPQQNMQQAGNFSWGKTILSNKENQTLKVIPQIKIDDINYTVFYYTTDNGFIFGSLSPASDLEDEVNMIAALTLFIGASIGVTFIVIMIFLMQLAFSPFDKVLDLIKSSISKNISQENNIEVQQISYHKINEFTPIVEALNEIYNQITTYLLRIQQSNLDLSASQTEVSLLNEELEEKVALRTGQLEQKTQEALISLNELKNTQQLLVEQEKNASLGRLVAGVAHEINTPLGVSITAISILSDEVHKLYAKFESDQLRKSDFTASYEIINESIDIVAMNLERTADLITSFKQVAADQSSEQQRYFNLYDYLNKIIRAMQPKLNQTKHKIIVKHQNTELKILSIPGVFAQITTNLVDNALTHAFTETTAGVITIAITDHIENIEITVADNGKGMSPDVIEAVFEPFFTTTRNTGGTGLGMHIVYNLVTQQLNGHIECKSQLEQGTTFTMVIPKKLNQ